MKKKYLTSFALFSVLALLAGCTTTSDKKEITILDPKSTSPSTVFDPKSSSLSNEIALEKMEVKKDVYPFDWLDNETILIRRSNKAKPKIITEGGYKVYPQNVYSYNLNTEEAKLIIDSDVNIGYALLSPDKKYVFYQESAEGSNSAYIYHIDTNRHYPIKNIGNSYYGAAQWIDEKSLLVTSDEHSTVFLSDINGNTTKLSDIDHYGLKNIKKVQNKLFCTDIGTRSLYVLDLENNRTNIFRKNISDSQISEDKSKVLLMNTSEEGNQFISIANIGDMEGKEDKTVYDSDNSLGFSWSPDNMKFAFTATMPSTQRIGLFVADKVGLMPVQIATDLKNAYENILWSPSGKILLISAHEGDADTFVNIAYVIRLK